MGWHPPKPGWIKDNSDIVRVDGGLNFAWGEVLSDSMGQLLQGFVVHMDAGGVIYTKLYGALHGLQVV